MKTNLQITIVSARDCNSREIQDLLNLEMYLSAHIRSQISLETRCLCLENMNPDFGVFVNGNLTTIRTLSDLIDYVHLSVMGLKAA